MIRLKNFVIALLGAYVTCAIVTADIPPKKLRILIVTGQNNHDWERTTPLIESFLKQTGRFEVTVTTSPSEQAPDDAWNAWQPRFKNQDVVLSDYNGHMWPDLVKKDFVEYVNLGGNVVILHAANNAFSGWKEYENMVGLLWRDKDYGICIHLNQALEEIRLPKGVGPSAGHGTVHSYAITTRDKTNPIFKDMPDVWLHASDELYHGQRGPGENMHLLATAYSSRESNGTGVHEPMVWWIPYGKGKVLSMMPGHLWKGQERPSAFDCVGFRVLLQRAVEWIGSGEVTIPLPTNFPTADQIRLIH